MSGFSSGLSILFLLGLFVAVIAKITSDPSEPVKIDVKPPLCIEMCVRELQSRGVFPHDYHETKKLCEDQFGQGDGCKLVGGVRDGK